MNILCIYDLNKNDLIDSNSGMKVYHYSDKEFKIVFKGKLKRNQKLINVLDEHNFNYLSKTDDEIIVFLFSLMDYDCLNFLDGYFSFVLYDGFNIIGCRDQLGILPLYYYLDNNVLVISSRVRLILDLKEKAIVDRNGIRELLALGPSITPGKTLYKDVYSVMPAHYLKYDKDKLNQVCYWRLKRKEHTDDYEGTLKHIRHLLINETLFHISDLDIPACFLSGGLDSSLICSIISDYYDNFNTYSLEYENQDIHFESNEYQTTQDRYYVDKMSEYLNNSNDVITVSQKELYENLMKSVIARDMPGMSDIDSSLYVLLSKIDENIILSGECADEIFGGYPWFYKKELYALNHFPWMKDLDMKLEFINKDLYDLNIREYIENSYTDSYDKSLSVIKRTVLLNYQWFMQTLIIRGESISDLLDKEIRMPFASKDLMEYLYNVPDEYFFRNGQEKSLLREAFKDKLPDIVLNRKKNPYPKTYSPEYTDLVVNELKEILKNKDSILYKLFDNDKLYELIESKGESFKYPWYGQLMKGPQFIAYLIQIDLWFNEYNIELEE